MTWTVAVLRGHELDLGCEPADVLNAFERLMTSAAAAPAVVRHSADRRGPRNKRIDPATTRILHRMPKPHQHQPTR